MRKIDVELLESALCNLENMERFIPLNMLSSALWQITKAQLETGLGHCTFDEAIARGKQKIMELAMTEQQKRNEDEK